MVPNGSAYANYPAFANNGTKTPPGGSTESAKYALGMVPADTFPAEWANYLFHGATAGITRLNADCGSIKKEINSVLSNFNITPDATDNDQLLECLNKLKAEAALAAHPVGSLYWTSSNENPATTFGGGTWVQIKDRFILAAGDTYENDTRDGEATVTLTRQQMPVHYHELNLGNTASEGTLTTAGFRGITTYTGVNTDNPDFSWTGTHSHGEQIGNSDYLQAEYVSTSSYQGGGKVGLSIETSAITTLQQNRTQITTSLAEINISGKCSGTHDHAITPYGYLYGRTDTNGEGSAHNNMPPYIVKFCWERTA